MLSREVELARLVLTRTLLARPLLIPLSHAYTSPCTVQLRRRIVNLASPFHLLNSSCTVLHTHCTAPPLALQPLALHPLAPLSTWMLAHPSSPHPAPPCPAINVDVVAPSVAPSAQVICAGASGEVDVADDGTHAASGVVASK